MAKMCKASPFTLPCYEHLLFTEVAMNSKASPRQLDLFPDPLPTWKSLPHERQQALREILSLLLEQALSQQTGPSVEDARETRPEKNHV